MEILGKVEEQDQYLQLQESFDDPAAQVEEETNYLDQEDCQPEVSEKPVNKPQVNCILLESTIIEFVLIAGTRPCKTRPTTNSKDEQAKECESNEKVL